MAIFQLFAFMQGAAAGGGAIVTTNLVHWWTVLDSASYPGTGTTWTDLQGNRDLSLTNLSFTSLSGYNSLYGTGNTDKAVGNVTSGTIQTSCTLELWIHPNTSQPSTTNNKFLNLLNWGNAANAEGLFFMMVGGDGTQGGITVNSDNLAAYNFGAPGWVSSPTAQTHEITRNAWNHVVYAQTSSGGTFYVNGQQNYTYSKTYNTRSTGGTYKLWRDNNGRYYDGGIAVARIYNGYSFSASDALNNYDVEKSNFGL